MDAKEVLGNIMMLVVGLLFVYRACSNVFAGYKNTKKKLGKED